MKDLAIGAVIIVFTIVGFVLAGLYPENWKGPSKWS